MTLEQLSAAATQELLPCPFCGCGPSNDEHAQQVQFYREISAPNGYVWCEGCGAEGPWRKDRDEAIAAWNHRTGQLVAVQPDDATVERYRHKKRGTVYEVIGSAELQVAGLAPDEGDHLAVYRGEDGKLWARPYDEFHDGRFEAMKGPKP